jgi:hypothetical protein
MNKINRNNPIFLEKKLSGIISGFLLMAVLALIFGPGVYAQFARQTGDTGWGYGYGYGYGFGGGFDGGTTAGYRTEGDVDSAVYEYNYGYGYQAVDVTYSAENGYSVTPTNMSSLIESGVMIPNGSNPAVTSEVIFTQKVTLTLSSGASVVIPSGITMASSGSNFDIADLEAGTATLSGLTAIDSVGSMQFGLPNLGLTLSAPGVTITIPITGVADGVSLDVYSKTPGGSWASLTTCTVGAVTTGTCQFTTTHLSDFAVGDICSPSSVLNGTVALYPSCTISCNSGYILRGSACARRGGNAIINLLSLISPNRVIPESEVISETVVTTEVVTQVTPSTSVVGQVINPKDAVALTTILGVTRDIPAENHLGNLAVIDAKEFGIDIVSADDRIAMGNFVAYGISQATKKLGVGERRAILRDYFETVGRSNIVWSDVERMTVGLKPLTRNLAKEQAQLSRMLKNFEMIYDRKPNFKDAKDDLSWNTLMYRIRFTRDLTKEQPGVIQFKNVYNRLPKTPLEWAIVRSLGYIQAK